MNPNQSAKILTNPQFLARLEHVRKSARPSGPRWIDPLKAAAWDAVLSRGFPSQKDEDWKYTNLSPLLTLPLAEADPTDKAGIPDTGRHFFQPDDITLVFTAGGLPPQIPGIPSGASGLSIKKFSDISGKEYEERLAPVLDQPSELFPDLNTALATEGLWIHISAHTRVKPLIHLCHVGSGGTAAKIHSPRVILTAEPFAEANLLMTFISPNGAAASFTNALTDIAVGPNAKISLTTVQNEDHGYFHINSTRVTQRKDSSFDNFSLTTGSRLTRNNLTVTLLEEGCSTFLRGLYLLYGTQHVDNHTIVNHIAPHCASNQLYKGILNEQSQAVFNGKIYVHPDAQQTNSYQLNKNLLMGEQCRVNTKPQLEIFADDVKCSHGATVGQLDENEVFYLQTRGIPQKTAVRMLAKGFAEELVLQLAGTPVQERLALTINPILEAVNL